MTSTTEDAMLLAKYEQKFFDMIIKTYDMLEQLDEARDEEFWRVFDILEVAYFEIKTAEESYFELLTREGETAHGCSLYHEFEYGIYRLDEKYAAIKDKVTTLEKKREEELQQKQKMKDILWDTYFGFDGTCLSHDRLGCAECRVPATGRCYSSLEE